MNKKIVLTCWFVLVWWASIAQTYPVQVSTTIMPPYSLYFSDYATSEKLAVNLLFNDPVRFELPVRFRLIIEGQGITISTKPEFNPRPFYLQSGFPERFTGADLAQYFDLRNLNVQGLDRRQLEKTGMLPEGVYRFCIEVWEHTQNKKVSNSGCAVVWMILNDPPVINYPMNGEKVRVQDPQLVIFNWTPRHTGSPNAAFATNYDFELVEVRSNDRNANNAILTTPPIFTTTTQSTSIYYSISETPLIPGQQYAFRVRAKAQAGVDELDLFKNKGYSEVFTFIYGDYCLSPEEVKITAQGPTSIQADWALQPAHTSFTVRYKEDKANAQWFEKKSMVGETAINSLRPNTEYLVQITGHCGVVRTENEKTYTVRTPMVEDGDFVCGSAADVVTFNNTTLIGSLSPGDFIVSNNFKIGLVEILPNGNDTYSGRGVAFIPWLRLAGLKVEFKNIKVNESRQVLEGNIVSVQSANSGWVWTGGDPAEEIPVGTVPSTGMPSDPENENGGESESPEVNIPVVSIEGEIESVTIDTDGNIVVTDTKGNITIVEDDKVVIKDSEGNEYAADGEGNIVNTTDQRNNGVADNNTNSGGDAASGPQPVTTISKESIQFLRDAIAQVRTQTDFSKLETLKEELRLKAIELKGSITNERDLLLRNARATTSESTYDVILIYDEVVDKQNDLPWGPSTFRSYKETENAYNQLRILKVICRTGLDENELNLLGSRLLIEGHPLDTYIAERKEAGLSSNKIIEEMSIAIVKLVESLL